MNDHQQIARIYKSRIVLLEILSDRGFNTEDLQNTSIADIAAMAAADQLDMTLERADDGEDSPTDTGKVYVKYNINNILRPNSLSDMVEDFFTINETIGPNDELLIVSKSDPNDSVNATTVDIWGNSKRFVTIISLERLQFNILKHTLVPQHSVLTEEEMQTVMRKYNVDHPSKFPVIPRFDPVAKAIGIRPGSLCKISRPSPTAIDGIYYRICV